MLDTENPDIVEGTESWLRSDIASSEVFPEGYHSFRADRKSNAASRGGVSLSLSRTIWSALSNLSSRQIVKFDGLR